MVRDMVRKGRLGAPDICRIYTGSEDFDEHDAEVTSLLSRCSQGLVVICSFNDDALVGAAVDEEEVFHDFERW